METPNCPYKPLGLPCTKNLGHGSPHAIDVEAAYIEKFVETHETRLLRVLEKSSGAPEAVLAAMRDAPRPLSMKDIPAFLLEQAGSVAAYLVTLGYRVVKFPAMSGDTYD